MVAVVDADARGALEEPLDREDGLRAGERRPGAGVDAAAEGEVLASVRPRLVERGRVLEDPPVAAGRAVQEHDDGAGRELESAELGRPLRQAERALDRRLDAQRLLDELRDEREVLAQPLLQLGVVGDALHADAHELDGRLLACGEEVRGDAGDLDRLGDRAVGERREGHPGQHVVLRVGAALLDAGDEVLVEPLEGAVVVRLQLEVSEHGAGRRGEQLEQHRVVLGGHAEEVGDGEDRVALAEVPDELALALGEDLVEEPVAGVLEELLVLLEPLGRDETHQDRAVVGVHGRVERDDLVVVREVARGAAPGSRRCRRRRARRAGRRPGRRCG